MDPFCVIKLSGSKDEKFKTSFVHKPQPHTALRQGPRRNEEHAHAYECFGQTQAAFVSGSIGSIAEHP